MRAINPSTRNSFLCLLALIVMKKTVFTRYRFVAALVLASVLSNAAVAQKADSLTKKANDQEINVHIIERNGDEVREIERIYKVDGMTDLERDKIVMKLVDSLKAGRKDGRKRQMTIIVEDNGGDRIVTRRPGTDAYAWRGRTSRPGGEPWTNHEWHVELRRGADSLADRMSRFRFQFPRDFDRQIARPFEDWARNVGTKTSTVRGLEAYPNNPDRNQLNIRFTAPAKGDVSIVITNPKGREVAKRTINDFSGEFVGQIDLGKNAKGTYFVTVTQHEDGAVRRVVVE